MIFLYILELIVSTATLFVLISIKNYEAEDNDKARDMEHMYCNLTMEKCIYGGNKSCEECSIAEEAEKIGDR